jgi:hypothetical protein
MRKPFSPIEDLLFFACDNYGFVPSLQVRGGVLLKAAMKILNDHLPRNLS